MGIDQGEALDVLHHALVYVKARFDFRMKRDEAKANLEARAILFNCSNRIFAEMGCGISREEVEGASIIEREYSASRRQAGKGGEE